MYMQGEIHKSRIIVDKNKIIISKEFNYMIVYNIKENVARCGNSDLI